MSREMWEAVETEAEKTRVVKIKERRGKGESRKEMKRESRKTEKETEERKNNGSEENSRGMGDLG